ncbi:MAG TPA: hypothetical protein DDW76_28605 [Cyanobacteria bacterium UBA11369]|nr:hypothetical protein [Cyanobacteria bacterium UBA11371]HBE34240.1 hypothetical protein [Cyanobacteria bacterium UBA11368]HBE52623.1 hypothetical protein [Cyanobacteria bacterium UBA11369]
MPLIEKLTPEQEALIPIYREKWRQIALSTERIDRKKATVAVKAAYAAIGKEEPLIAFYDSPYTSAHIALSNLIQQHKAQLASLMWEQIGKEVRKKLWLGVRLALWNQLNSQLVYSFEQSRGENCENCIYSYDWARSACLFDFCTNVLNCPSEGEKWELFQDLVKNCGYIFPYANTCVVCDRPIELSFDNRGLLHAEGKPAIQFADGYSVYAYHGVRLPGKYGSIPPKQWRGKWLLKERNAELRRVLIQGIGYARICQELQATELDTWQEYTLLKIDSNLDVEDIYLLKMTCPSTGYIHALRVPPDVQSAREAIAWVNWGIDPEEFAVQT